MKSPLIMRLLLALIHDVSRLEPDVKGLDRDIITIKARFEHEGIGFVAVALPSYCDAIDHGLAVGRFACPLGFSKSHGGALPKLFSGLLCNVFEARTGNLKEGPCVRSIKCLREVLRLFKKLKLSDEREELLHIRAVGAFWKAELHINRSNFDPLRADLLSRVSGFSLRSLDSFEPSELLPKHGPGAVYERLAPNQKWSGVVKELVKGSLALTEYGFDAFSGSYESDDVSSQRSVVDCSDPSGSLQSTYAPLDGVSYGLSSGRCARLVTVAKNSQSRRTITVEPLLSMFVQQGLNSALRSEIDRCPVLKQSLALTSQIENQKLALIGSQTGEWSTLDLSQASDLLSLSLVELVFARHKRFLSLMIGCRSTHVYDELQRSDKPVSKFAGMGNALTFPVQSVVFALLAISAICHTEGCSRPSYWMVKRTSRLVRVYGDDIIVPTRYVHQVMDWIESFGLLVNRMKSFTEGNFRESCGIDAFKGYDVTPVYIRADPAQSSSDPSVLASLVSASNQCWFRGLYTLSNELKELVEEGLGSPLPFVSLNSGALGWHTRDDRCSYQKWDANLHRLIVKAPFLKPTTRRDKISGYAALLKFFLTPLIQRDREHLRRSIKRFSTKIAWRWMPVTTGDIYIPQIEQIWRYKS